MYTPEGNQEIDIIFNAFRPYIEEHPDFDIIYSPKIGYFKLFVRDAMQQVPIIIKRWDRMLESVLAEIMADEEETNPNAIFENAGELESAVRGDAERCRQRARPFLEAIEGDNQPYLDFLDWYVEHYIELHGI